MRRLGMPPAPPEFGFFFCLPPFAGGAAGAAGAGAGGAGVAATAGVSAAGGGVGSVGATGASGFSSVVMGGVRKVPIILERAARREEKLYEMPMDFAVRRRLR